MNGLQIIDLNEASFMDKLLRREPQENAYVEINNLLACVPILRLDREAIEKCLEKHRIEYAEGNSRLLNFYSIILKYFLGDSNLEQAELEKLHHLKYVLRLDDNDVGIIHRNSVQPLYQNYIRKASSDGELTNEEKEVSNKLAERLYIPDDYALELYANEASKYLHSVLKTSLEDGMLSDGEEEELERIAKNLQVQLKFTEDAKRNLERCRNLWKLHQGELPRVKTSLRLGKNEHCSAYVDAALYNVSNAKQPVKYSGYQKRKGDEDFGFHSGVLNSEKIAGKVIRFVDQGVLYFTNERLLFNGTDGDKNFPIRKLSGGTFYQNGFLIEQKRSRDRFFQFDGDKKALQLIFDSLMTSSRK